MTPGPVVAKTTVGRRLRRACLTCGEGRTAFVTAMHDVEPRRSERLCEWRDGASDDSECVLDTEILEGARDLLAHLQDGNTRPHTALAGDQSRTRRPVRKTHYGFGAHDLQAPIEEPRARTTIRP